MNAIKANKLIQKDEKPTPAGRSNTQHVRHRTRNSGTSNTQHLGYQSGSSTGSNWTRGEKDDRREGRYQNRRNRLYHNKHEEQRKNTAVFFTYFFITLVHLNQILNLNLSFKCIHD